MPGGCCSGEDDMDGEEAVDWLREWEVEEDLLRVAPSAEDLEETRELILMDSPPEPGDVKDEAEGVDVLVGLE